MRRETKLAIGLALLLTSTGVLRAQVNPTTPINAARNAAQQQSQPPAQNPPAKTPQDKKPSTPPVTSTPPATKQTTPPKPAASAPANQATKPPVTKPPATNTATNPPAAKTPATKPPATNATSNAAQKPPATQAQTTPKNAPPKAVPPKPSQAKAPPAGTPPAKAPAANAAAKPAPKTPKSAETTKVASAPARRDPFVTLIGRDAGGASGPPIKLPPGIAGLQVSTLILQGIVSGPTGMIAVVANPQRSVYFLHVGDKLFDGNVEHIEIGAVTFHETGKDAFGKPLEREVVRRLNSSSGEQP